MYLKFNIIGLFPIFLFLTCITVIKTEKSENVNFVVFYDLGDNGVGNVIDSAIQRYTTKLNLGEVYRIQLDTFNSTIASIALSSFKKLLTTKIKRPIFALDFTRNWFSGMKVKIIVQKYKFPTISTNLEPQGTNINLWSKLNQTMRNYLIQLQSPEIIMGNIATGIILSTGSKEAFVENGNNSFAIMYRELASGRQNSTYTIHDFSWLPSVKTFLEIFDVKVIFIIGSQSEATNTLNSLSNFTTSSHFSPFSCRYSWFYMSTHVGEKFECPSHVEHLFLLEPQLKQSTGLKKGIKEFGTKNITDLFYFDVFRSVIQTYLFMKKNGDWTNREIEDSEYELDLRKNLQKVLLSENNFLGKYFEDSDNIFQPNITFKLRINFPVRNESLRVGEIVNQEILFDNWDLWENYYVLNFIHTWAISDLPFVIKTNKTCFHEFIGFNGEKCFDGFVIDLIRKIQQEHNETIFVALSLQASDGNLKNNFSTDWYDAIYALQTQEIDMGLGAFKVTPERAKVVDFSEPFYYDKRNNQSYAFVFPKGKFPKLQALISHTIKKLKNQRYTEQLKEIWFKDYKRNYTLSDEH